MKLWIILASILVSTACGYVDEWGLIHFSKSEKKLRECLKNETDLAKVLREHVNKSYRESYVISRLSYYFHEVTVPVESINAVADNLVNYLGSATFIFSKYQSNSVKEAIVDALKKCSDPEKPTGSNQSNHHDPPRFVQEIPELAKLFDMMLVQPSFYTRNSSLSLNFLSFFDKALSLIELGLRRLGNAHEFTNELIRMWNRRARLYFNCDSIFYKYINHYCTGNSVYTPNNASCFVQRRRVNYTARDPIIGNYNEVFDLTQFHSVDCRDYRRSHVSATANMSSLTKSRYYFEKCKMKFLLRLFFYLDLMERGVPEEDIRSDFYILYLEDLSEVLYGTTEDWIRFLETRQSEELTDGFANNSVEFSALIKNLQEGDLIEPVDLLMMFWHRLIGSDKINKSTENLDLSYEAFNDPSAVGPSNSHTNTTTSTTAPSSDTSSTLGYKESKRGKGQVIRLLSGKFKPKNQHESYVDEGPSSLKKYKYSQRQMDITKEFFGYIINNTNKTMFLVKKTVPSEKLQEIFSTAIKNAITN